MDIHGRVLRRGILEKGGRIYVSNLADGVYLLNIPGSGTLMFSCGRKP
jgi:hypothetical protein